MINYLKLISMVCFFCAFVTSHLSSNQDFLLDESQATIVIDVYDNTVILPMMDWQIQEAKKISADRGNGFMKADRQVSRLNFIYEMIPPDETFDKWTKIYAIFGINTPTNPPINIDQHLQENIFHFTNSCSGLSHKIDRAIGDDPNAIIITFYCQTLKGTNEGEIALKYIKKTSNNKIIHVYHEWKGQQFKKSDESSWPVTELEINEAKRRFERIQIIPSPNI